MKEIVVTTKEELEEAVKNKVDTIICTLLAALSMISAKLISSPF